jgi:predicted amidohydrolase YtcJ
MRVVFVGLSILIVAACTTPQPPLDLVVVNGRVFTGVPAQPWSEAVAIRRDRIVAVGGSSDIRAQAAAATRVIDAGGRLVIPGINDAHVHPGATPPFTVLEGPPAMQHDPGFTEILQRLKQAVPKSQPGDWVFGEIGASVLDDPAATRFALDAIAPDRLVVLQAWTGHGALYNTAALRRLGVGDEEPDPPGGFYVRVPGKKTISGIAHEYANFRLSRALQMESRPEARLAAFRQMAEQAASFGITSLQAMMTALPTPDAVGLLASASLPVRLRLIDFPMTAMSEWQNPAARTTATGGPVTVSGTKWILDGTPIERLMFVRAPYADRSDTQGRLNFSQDELSAFLGRAMSAGEQPLLHAVGDAAVDALLASLEQSGGEQWQRLRPRLEHGDMLEPSQFDRARRLGVVLVQNPSHFMLGPLGGVRLGPERKARTTMVKTASAAGVPLAFGSDGPLNPFLNIMFATINANNPAEALSREQALVAYTQGSAFAELAEREKGTIEAGKLADVAVLSQDIFAISADALPGTTSVLTIVGGRVVHDTLAP